MTSVFAVKGGISVISETLWNQISRLVVRIIRQNNKIQLVVFCAKVRMGVKVINETVKGLKLCLRELTVILRR